MAIGATLTKLIWSFLNKNEVLWVQLLVQSAGGSKRWQTSFSPLSSTSQKCCDHLKTLTFRSRHVPDTMSSNERAPASMCPNLPEPSDAKHYVYHVSSCRRSVKESVRARQLKFAWSSCSPASAYLSACVLACRPAWLLDCLRACLPTWLPDSLPCLLACSPACPPARLPACLPGCLTASLPACHLPACLPACLPVCLPTCLPDCLPACLPADCLHAHLHIFWFACLSDWLRACLHSLDWLVKSCAFQRRRRLNSVLADQTFSQRDLVRWVVSWRIVDLGWFISLIGYSQNAQSTKLPHVFQIR